MNILKCSREFYKRILKNVIDDDNKLEDMTFIEIIPDSSKQILAREYKIFDKINRLLYYFVVDKKFIPPKELDIISKGDNHGEDDGDGEDDNINEILQIEPICKLIELVIKIN